MHSWSVWFGAAIVALHGSCGNDESSHESRTVALLIFQPTRPNTGRPVPPRHGLPAGVGCAGAAAGREPGHGACRQLPVAGHLHSVSQLHVQRGVLELKWDARLGVPPAALRWPSILASRIHLAAWIPNHLLGEVQCGSANGCKAGNVLRSDAALHPQSAFPKCCWWGGLVARQLRQASPPTSTCGRPVWSSGMHGQFAGRTCAWCVGAYACMFCSWRGAAQQAGGLRHCVGLPHPANACPDKAGESLVGVALALHL